MDIRRLPLWEGRNAALMTNDLLRALIEDQGAMTLELSANNNAGGRVNALTPFWYRGTGISVFNDDNSEFWRNDPLLYQKAGRYLCFPNFGSACQRESVFHDVDGYSANGYWMVERYGIDSSTKGAWLLSSLTSREPGNRWTIRKVDLMLPKHPVLYTSCTITNNGADAIESTIGWRNMVSPPFLESGCVVNSGASHWMAMDQSMVNITGRLAPGVAFDDLKKAPLSAGGTVDLTQVPAMNGYTDLAVGALSPLDKLGWTSVINPRQQLMYFTFFPGPAALEGRDIPLNFNNLTFDFGGRNQTPWSMYDGGASQVYNVGCGSSTSFGEYGLSRSLAEQTLFDMPTSVVFEPHETRSLWYGTAYTTYENPRIGNNFYSIEQVVEGIVAKRTKSWAFIPADSTFHHLKTLTRSLLAEA